MKILFGLLFSLLPAYSLLAQRYYPSGIQSREKFSLGIGSASYFGDLQEEGYFSSTPNLMLSYEFLLNPRWSLRADGLVYQLKASDANASSLQRQARNLSFHSTNYEISSSLMLYLFRQDPVAYQKRALVNVYVLAGIGATYFNPKTTLNGETYSLGNLQTEGIAYQKWSPVIPSGGGLLLKVNPKLDVALEITYRLCFTDYLDDVSTVYPDPETLSSPIAIALSDRRLDPGMEGSARGNPALKDGYGLYNLRVVYYMDRMYYWAKEKKKRKNRSFNNNLAPLP